MNISRGEFNFAVDAASPSPAKPLLAAVPAK